MYELEKKEPTIDLKGLRASQVVALLRWPTKKGSVTHFLSIFSIL